jgi:pyrroloquinoline quinone biosynthesis protein B
VRRTQSSAAVSADGERWFLLNCSPDVHDQLACLPGLVPNGTRHVPVAGIVLTDAELDHTIGMVLLRESRHLQLYSTTAVQTILEDDSRLLPTTRAFARVETTDLPLDQRVPLRYQDGSLSEISVQAFAVPAGPPRFAGKNDPGHTVGLLLHDAKTGGTCAYVPGCGELDPRLLGILGETDLVLFDGTFWTDNELISLGISDRTSRAMDHQPVSGDDGSLVRLASLTRPRTVYTHMNNTNAMLLEDSPERESVEQAGIEVGADGMSFFI